MAKNLISGPILTPPPPLPHFLPHKFFFFFVSFTSTSSKTQLQTVILCNLEKKPNFWSDFGPFGSLGPNLEPQNFFREFYFY